MKVTYFRKFFTLYSRGLLLLVLLLLLLLYRPERERETDTDTTWPPGFISKGRSLLVLVRLLHKLHACSHEKRITEPAPSLSIYYFLFVLHSHRRPDSSRGMTTDQRLLRRISIIRIMVYFPIRSLKPFHSHLFLVYRFRNGIKRRRWWDRLVVPYTSMVPYSTTLIKGAKKHIFIQLDYSGIWLESVKYWSESIDRL